MDYGPSLPPHLRDDQSRHDPDTSDQYSGQSDEPSQVTSARPQKHADKRHDTDPRHASDQHSALSDEPTQVTSARPKKHADKRKHKVRSRYVSSSSEANPTSTRSRPTLYREVSLADISSQYAEEVDTFRRILDLPDPRETMPRSLTSVLSLDDEKGRQELRPRGPSSMLPLSSIIKDAFDKFE